MSPTGGQTTPCTAFRSSDPEETRHFVERLFESPHRQRIVRRSEVVKARIDSARAGSIGVRYVEYGTAVVLDDGALDCFLVQMPVKGCIETQCGEERIDSTARRFAVLSPGQAICMRWSADAGHLVLQLDRSRLERHVESAIGASLHAPLRFQLEMNAESPAGGSMVRFARYLFAELAGEQTALREPLVMSHFESGMMTALLSTQPHNYSELLRRPAEPAPPHYVRRAEEYMRAHAHQPIRMADLVELTGVSARTLCWGFERHLGVAPMAHLRAIRLEGAREELRRADPATASVTNVALGWGFAHFGRFARDYGIRFHERPSDTLRHRPILRQ